MQAMSRPHIDQSYSQGDDVFHEHRWNGHGQKNEEVGSVPMQRENNVGVRNVEMQVDFRGMPTDSSGNSPPALTHVSGAFSICQDVPLPRS